MRQNQSPGRNLPKELILTNYFHIEDGRIVTLMIIRTSRLRPGSRLFDEMRTQPWTEVTVIASSRSKLNADDIARLEPRHPPDRRR